MRKYHNVVLDVIANVVGTGTHGQRVGAQRNPGGRGSPRRSPSGDRRGERGAVEPFDSWGSNDLRFRRAARTQMG